MRKTGLFSSTALPLLLTLDGTATSVAADQRSIPLHSKFYSHLKCPYANKWLTKGPEQAARELGLDEHHRRRKLQQTEEQPIQGSCTYTNSFTQAPTCLQFDGSAWTTTDMNARCSTENGAFTTEEGCDTEGSGGDMGGWCTKMIDENKYESTMMVLSPPMGDCRGSKMACESFMSGSFVAGGECVSAESIFDSNMSDGPPPAGVDISGGESSWPGGATATSEETDPTKCLLAPGAIGAAHQAGFSKGYSNSCPGAPGQESPYMWPLKWAADTESHSMAYGSDEVIYTSRGRTFYSLDQNWKRSDTTFQEGQLRTIGQGPCDDIDEDFAEETGFLGCLKNMTDGTITTMIHRENKMYFISWKDDEEIEVGERDATKIEECNMINLAVVGNIRPDWFLDNRGDDTDVQYLGNQHAYYADGDIPKLVKQWRKKDFASQYFVMSMMGNPPNYLKQDPDAPIEDNMHWPLILNVPGEGFGDDFLQVYRNHALLTEGDDDLFLLIENYEAAGGECIDIRAQQSEGMDVGPPVLEEGEEIQSNLVVDPLSWVSNEITFSPIWVPEKTFMTEETSTVIDIGSTISSLSDLATSIKDVIQPSDRVTVESCYDETTQLMDLSIHYHDIAPSFDGLLPWMALGYRSSALCAMTPPTGGVTPVVLLMQDSEDVPPQAYKTQLVPEAKALSSVAFESMTTMMRPLNDVDGYMDVSINAPMASTNAAAVQVARSSSLEAEDTVTLHFKQDVGEKPETMNLMFAIGMSSQLGVHITRGCFEVQPTPCKNQDMESESINLGENEVTVKTSVAAGMSSSGVVFALSAVVMMIVGL